MTMTTSKADQVDNKVLIVGAGLGGLVLAQVLRKQGILFELFERDERPDARAQGWAVALVEVLPELRKRLPSDVPPLRQASVNRNLDGAYDELTLMNATDCKISAQLGGVAEGHPAFILRTDRQRLREVLWTNLEVSTGKCFDSYEEDDSGVTARFRDGTQARGSMLVGADGAWSHVRDQLMTSLPHEPVLSEYIPLVGECELPREKYEPIRAMANAVIIAISPGLLIQIGQRSIAPDLSSATYFWAVCFQSRTPAVDSAWAHSASKEELYQKVLEVTKDVHPSLMEIVLQTGVKGMVAPPIKFVEFVSPESLPSSRVTLLGDAAHSMIPFKAAGANTAIQDALDLADLVVNRARGSNDMTTQELLQQYEAKMLPRGREKFLASRAAGQGKELPAVSNTRVNMLKKE